jgi:hypothetical protein
MLQGHPRPASAYMTPAWTPDMMSDMACLLVSFFDHFYMNELEDVVENLKFAYGRNRQAAALAAIPVEMDMDVAFALGINKHGSGEGIFDTDENLADKISGFCKEVGVPNSDDDAENCWKPYKYELYNTYTATVDRAQVIARYVKMAKDAWEDSDGEWDQGDRVYGVDDE